MYEAQKENYEKDEITLIYDCQWTQTKCVCVCECMRVYIEIKYKCSQKTNCIIIIRIYSVNR